MYRRECNTGADKPLYFLGVLTMFEVRSPKGFSKFPSGLTRGLQNPIVTRSSEEQLHYIVKKQVICHVTIFNISLRDLQFQYRHVIVKITSRVHEVAV